jgi:exonuclease III
VTTNRRDTWFDLLRDELGYTQIAESLAWAKELGQSAVPPHQDIAHSTGNITAVLDDATLQNRRPSIRDNEYDRSDRKDYETSFPEKILVTGVEFGATTVEIWNIRAVPGSSWGEEKVKIFETAYNRLTKSGTKTRLLDGDFNSPKRELPDGQAVPFGYDKTPEIRRRYVNAELNILKGLGHLGMVDVFRYLHGHGDLDVLDYSWKHGSGANKRFDHLFASGDLTPVTCVYDRAGFECSDHAPIVAEFDV